VTTRTNARSQLAPIKQCGYSSIVVTFFLTKNYNENKIFSTKHHFVCFCFANATMLMSVNSMDYKKARFWQQ